MLEYLKKKWQVIKETFVNFETIEGTYYVVAAIVLLLFPKFILTLAIVGLGLLGVYKIFVNRVWKAHIEEQQLEARKERTSE